MKGIAFILVIFQASMLMAAGPQDAVVDITAHISVDAQGRAVRRIRITRTMKTAWAVDKLSDPKIRFDATRQDLKIITARTITADNRIIPARKVAQNLSTLPELAKAPELALHREMVVTMLGIEIGCKTILEYEIRDRKPLPFGRVWRFATPLHQYIHSFKVTVESKIPVNRVMLNTWPGTRPITRNNGKLTMTWSDQGPFNKNNAPILVIYRSDGLDRAMRGIGIPKGGCPILDSIIAKALKKQGTARFAAVLKSIKSAIRVLPLAKDLFAEVPQGVCDVLKRGYATPLEAAMVLKKAMNDAGFQAGLEFYGPKIQPTRAQTLWAMTTAAVKVAGVTDGDILVRLPDFVLSDESIALSGRNYLILKKNPHVAMGPAIGCNRGLTRKVIADLRIHANGGYAGFLNIELRHNVPGFMSVAKDPKAWAKSVADKILPKSRVMRYRVLHLSSGLVSVSIRVTGKLGISGREALLALPQVAKPFESVLSDLTGPFRKDGLMCNSVDFRLTLPKAWKAVTPVDAIADACKSGKFRYKTSLKGRVLHIKSSFNMTASYLDHTQIGPLQHIVRTSMAPALWRVLLISPKDMSTKKVD